MVKVLGSKVDDAADDGGMVVCIHAFLLLCMRRAVPEVLGLGWRVEGMGLLAEWVGEGGGYGVEG